MPDHYIGIDPSAINGTSYGGITFFDSTGYPSFTIPLNQERKRIKDLFFEATEDLSCVACMEYTWAMFGQAASSSYTFGNGAGFIEGLIVSRDIPYFFVKPQEWMQHFGMKKEKGEKQNDWKKRLCLVANDLFPNYNTDHYLCDSILITKYLYDNQSNQEFFS